MGLGCQFRDLHDCVGHTHLCAGCRDSPASASEDDYPVDGSRLDGDGMHPERASMRPDPLLSQDPFLLLMAAVMPLHGFEFFWLGPNGWLGLTLLVVGGGLLWYLPERLWGKYSS